MDQKTARFTVWFWVDIPDGPDEDGDDGDVDWEAHDAAVDAAIDPIDRALEAIPGFIQADFEGWV